ncbi:uncharacterized protein F54F2.9 [Euwallacea fornicatus]|uniref:uncharacterized protein F54F2.9 n=1 Tax=Euwallacea fornicatus TaxID=995702 RepID=UPI00338E5C72
MMKHYFVMLLMIMCTKTSHAWDSEQLEVFDVVDAVKDNFYEMLNISQDASSYQIRSAFRTLSLTLHPDKNLETDTSEQFRNLVSVYDILRSPAKRKYYDEVLVNGLPNWKSAVYYYRYVRKVGMAEACAILFILVTIGQYAVKWATYYERIFTIRVNAKKLTKAKLVRAQTKKLKSSDEVPKNSDENLISLTIEVPKPSFLDTIPFQLPKLLWAIVISLPSTLGMLKTAVAQQIEEVTKVPPEPEPEPIRVKTVRKRNKFVVPEGANFEIEPTGKSGSHQTILNCAPVVSGGLWTDDDLDELVRLVKKYPQGSAKRWENIAESLSRSVPEVTYMANKIKEDGYKLPVEKEDECIEIKVKQKTKKFVDVVDDNTVKNWSQIQQKALEEALSRYSKRHSDRWDKIGDYVPGKTKEECMLRFKYLTELLKKQKELACANTEGEKLESTD